MYLLPMPIHYLIRYVYVVPTVVPIPEENIHLSLNNNITIAIHIGAICILDSLLNIPIYPVYFERTCFKPIQNMSHEIMSRYEVQTFLV